MFQEGDEKSCTIPKEVSKAVMAGVEGRTAAFAGLEATTNNRLSSLPVVSRSRDIVGDSA